MRNAIAINKEFHDRDGWCCGLTYPLVERIISEFGCEIALPNVEYDFLLSFERFVGSDFSGHNRWILISDPHGDSLRRQKLINANFDGVLAYYWHPTHADMTFDIPVKHFPWSISEGRIAEKPVFTDSGMACFGASGGPFYSVRDWCKGFDFVHSFAYSGVSNKVFSAGGYWKMLSTWDCCVAAGSDRYDLTTGKYFEIPAAGCLLFAQFTFDLARLGFRDMENCVIFDRTNFEEKARAYLADPESYMDIRQRGIDLISSRHSHRQRMELLHDISVGK